MSRVKIFFLGLLIACGCQSKEEKVSQQVVKINLGHPQTLDPRLARDPNAQMVMRMLFEGLTRIGPDDQPQLALAKSVEISKDLKTYTFTLREATWSNGDPILASDFVYSWKTSLRPNFASDNAYQLYMLKNGREVKEGVVSADELGARALDEKTLLIELGYPTPYFLELLALSFFYPIPQKVEEANPHWAEKKESFVSNGPFFLKELRHQDHLLALKNPTYWDAVSVHLDGIDLIMIEGDTELELFEKKELHWAGSPLSTLPVDAIESFQKTGRLHVKPKAETAFLRTNTDHPLLKSLSFRKSLALAMDRKALVDHVTRGGQLPAFCLLPPSLQLSNEPYFHDGDRQLAALLFKEALEELNFPQESLPELTLLYIHSHRSHLVAQALQDQWRATLGLSIRLEATERKVFFDRISHQDYDLAFCSWGADFHDPINFLEVFKYKSQSTNNTGWEDPEYAKTLQTSFSLIDPLERMILLRQAEKTLMEAMPIIPIFYYSMLYLRDDHLQNVFLSSLGNLDFKWATLDNEAE